MAFYTVVNMVSGRKYGTFSNKKEALKCRTWARHLGYENNARFRIHVIKDYRETERGEDPDEIEKINRENLVIK